MAALFNSSANNINTAALPGPFANITNSPTVGNGDGPQGINTIHCDGQGNFIWLPNIGININGNGLILGAGFNITSFGHNAVAVYAIGSTDAALNVFSVHVAADGSISAQFQTGASSPSGTFTFGNRHELEVAITEFSAGGTITVYLDGVAVTNLTGISVGNLTSLQNGGTIHSVAVGGSGEGGLTSTTVVVDSTYAFDTTGSHCNAPVGPAISVIMIPNATGQNSAWTPNGASNGWQCINDIPPDGDTTYISDNTPNDEESVNLTPPSGITGVYAVSVIADQRQDTAGGGRTIQLGLGDGSTRSYGTAWGLGTTYKMNTTAFSSNPFTSSAWVLADMAALQSAVKLAS